jgi:hypothetical protein
MVADGLWLPRASNGGARRVIDEDQQRGLVLRSATRLSRSSRMPRGVLLRQALCVPGQRPAQPARCAAEGNLLMFRSIAIRNSPPSYPPICRWDRFELLLRLSTMAGSPNKSDVEACPYSVEQFRGGRSERLQVLIMKLALGTESWRSANLLSKS